MVRGNVFLGILWVLFASLALVGCGKPSTSADETAEVQEEGDEYHRSIAEGAASGACASAASQVAGQTLQQGIEAYQAGQLSLSPECQTRLAGLKTRLEKSKLAPFLPDFLGKVVAACGSLPFSQKQIPSCIRTKVIRPAIQQWIASRKQS